MKSAVLYTVIASLSFSGLNAQAQGTCSTGGGQYPVSNYASPYATNGAYPSAAQVQWFLSQAPAAVASPAFPQARITVVDSTAPSEASSTSAASSTTSARITVVSSTSFAAESGSMNDALKGLVGNWTAVARYGDNELTTVELQLDDRGWATLTVPDSEGKPKTIKRRVEFKNDEIRLTGPEAEMVLGKLVSANGRQMVLEKAGGQVTFVRM